MDNAGVYDERTVVHELTQGLQMAQHLRVNLHTPEARDVLIPKILSSYDNALFVLQSGHSAGQPPSPALSAPSLPESPISFRSPGSDEFEFSQPFSGQEGENVISKKRKGSTTWEDEVRICIGNGLEGDINDGHSWRKYGQKDILGAKFPRSYYRCSYRNVQKCFARKQVQRNDEDPTEFQITYKGKHTCHHGTAQSVSPSPPPPPPPPSSEITPSPSEMLSNLRANLSVNTLDLGGDSDTIRSLFSFPSTSSGMMEDFPNFYDDQLLPIFSPPFVSPVTPESNIFSEWGSSQSLDFLPDIDPEFKFNTFL